MEAVSKKRQQQDRKNTLRRQYRQAREAIFIKDYICERHPEAYQEAAAFYNHVNSMYPEKRDLRRTDEFKAVKLGFTYVQKKRTDVHKPPKQVFQPIIDVSQEEYTVVFYKPPETAAETETHQVSTETETQQSASQTETHQPATQTETQQSASQTETHQPATQTETQQSASQTETHQPATQTEIQQSATNQQPKRIMELKIPLMSPDLFTQTVTQEIVEENLITTACSETLTDDIDSFLNEEIPQDVYETILTELRKDAGLCKIMDDIELNPIMDDIELDPCDMEIDLPVEDDRLEQELYNLW